LIEKVDDFFVVLLVADWGPEVDLFCRLVQQSKKFVPGSLIGVKDSDFVGRPEAETP
jgi:hypothetical protein